MIYSCLIIWKSYLKEDEIKIVEKFLDQGGRVLALGYYKNEDMVANAKNSLIKIWRQNVT